MISVYMICLATQAYSWAISDVLTENNHFLFPNSTASIREKVIMMNGKWDYMDPDYYYIGDIALTLFELVCIILAMACCCPIMCCIACVFYSSRSRTTSPKKFKKNKEEPLLRNVQPIYEQYGSNQVPVHGQYVPVTEYIPQHYSVPNYPNIQASAPPME